MTLSGDLSNLQDALDVVKTASLDPAAIVKLLDTAILTPVVEAGRIVASYQINGREMRMAISEARELRKYYDQLAKDQDTDGAYDCLEVTL